MKRLVLALAAVSLLLGACGGDDDDGATADTPTVASNTTTTSSEASPAATKAATATGVPSADEAAAAITKMDPPLDLADGQAIGKSGALTLTVFEDFQCPFCLNYTVKFEDTIVTEYVKTGKLRYEVKHLPILGAESAKAAAASYCSSLQNHFWELHKQLFLVQAQANQLQAEKTNIGRFSDDKLRQYAVDAGADGAQFDACYAADSTVDALTEQIRAAQTLGFRGTPSFALDGQALPGSPTTVDGWRKLLDDALAARK
jgi:protein-disulfide isomerase